MRFIVLTVLTFMTLYPGATLAEKLMKTMPIEDEFKGVLRGFIWGLPRTVILENEKAAFVGEQDGALLYVDYIRGLKCSIIYDFDHDKLRRIRIVVEKRYIDPNETIEDLLKVHEDLNRRFGKPAHEEMKWYDDLEKHWPKNWGWAIYRKELLMRTMWRTVDTQVETLLYSPKRYEPQLSITYQQIETKLQKKNDLLLAP